MCRVIAIYGASAVGKTTVAKRLADRLHCEVRHCGDAIKAQATLMGIAPEKLPKQVHEKIDNETRLRANGTQGLLIIEGRFLREVLAGAAGVLFVELTCIASERERRHASREVGLRGAGLGDRDATSCDLHSKLYSPVGVSTEHAVTISTEGLTVANVVETILRQWRSLVAGPVARQWQTRYETGDTPWITGYPSTELAFVLNEHRLDHGIALEVGCGTGTNSVYMACRGLRVTGVDIASNAVAEAGRRATLLNIGHECTFVDANVFEFCDGREDEFSFLFDRGFFHCLPKLLGPGWAEQATRLLCGGGLMLVLTGSEDEPRQEGPPKLSSTYLLSTFLPYLSVVHLRQFAWDAVAGSDWRALGWSLLLRKPLNRT